MLTFVPPGGGSWRVAALRFRAAKAARKKTILFILIGYLWYCFLANGEYPVFGALVRPGDKETKKCGWFAAKTLEDCRHSPLFREGQRPFLRDKIRPGATPSLGRIRDPFKG